MSAISKILQKNERNVNHMQSYNEKKGLNNQSLSKLHQFCAGS